MQEIRYILSKNGLLIKNEYMLFVSLWPHPLENKRPPAAEWADGRWKRERFFREYRQSPWGCR